jgi:hypothetical protein
VTVGLLDELDRDAEAFAEAIDREHYLQGSGQKDALELTLIYRRHARLFTRETIDALQGGDRGDERWPELRRLAVEGYLDAAANPITEEIASLETSDTVEWDGQAVPYRGVAPLIRNEAAASRRHDLERRLATSTASQNPLRERRWDALYEKARDLGYETYRSMCEDVGRLDIAALVPLCERFLRETATGYRSQLVERLRGIGIDPAFAEKSDLAYVFRAPEYDEWFAADKIVGIYNATIAGLGLTGDEQRRIILDVEPRPKKSPRAFCAAPRIPDEIYLVTNPQGGQYDYETMLHEGGHAEHFAHADGSLPFALKGLGDNSVTEGFAFVLEHICSEAGWLSRHLGFDDPEAYLRMQRFNRLYMFRRYSAKLLYEAELHAGPNVRGHQKRYADLLTAATGVRYSPEDYLFDVDDAFYCARYLRAWIFDAQLRDMLRERFGDGWWCSPTAAAKLVELWSHGQRYTAPELLEREGLGPLDIGPLMQEVSV